MKVQQIHFHWWNNKNNWNDAAQSFFKISQHETTYYILWAIKTLFQKLKNPNQGHMTSHHKDIKYATKKSIMPWRHQVMPRRHQICHKDIKYAMKTLIMPQKHQSTTKTRCQDSNVTKTDIWLGNHTYHGTRVKTT